MNQFVSFLICNNFRSNTMKEWAIGGESFNENFYKCRNLGNNIKPVCLLLPRGYGGMDSFMIELGLQENKNIKTITMITPPSTPDINTPDCIVYIENLIERQKNHIIFSLIEPVYGFRKYELTNPFKMDDSSGIYGVISPEKTYIIRIEFEDTKFSFIP